MIIIQPRDNQALIANNIGTNLLEQYTKILSKQGQVVMWDIE